MAIHINGYSEVCPFCWLKHPFEDMIWSLYQVISPDSHEKIHFLRRIHCGNLVISPIFHGEATTIRARLFGASGASASAVPGLGEVLTVAASGVGQIVIEQDVYQHIYIYIYHMYYSSIYLSCLYVYICIYIYIYTQYTYSYKHSCLV